MDDVTEAKIEEFRQWLSISKSKYTVSNYISTLRNFFESVDKRYDEVELSDIMRFLSRYDNPNTIARHARALRAFYRFLDMYKLANKIPVPKTPKGRLVYVSSDDISVGLEAIDQPWWCRYKDDRLCRLVRLRDKLIILLSWWCGLRIGEAYMLNVLDVDFGREEIVIHREKVVEDQRLPLPKELIDMLKEYISLRDDDCEALFVCGDPPRRCSLEMLRLIFKKFAKAIGRPELTFHALRHGAGTRLAKSEKDVLTIAEWLHHKNPATSMIYIHLTSKDLRRRVMGSK